MATDEIIYNNGDEFFNEVLAAISVAKSTIQFETYIFDQDALGLKILEALSEATKRGVAVQLLLDGVGCSSWSFQDAVKWRTVGIQLKFFHALPWQKHRSIFLQSFSFRRLTLGFFKLKHRNHRKTCIIDDTICFVGSMNVSVRHLPSAFGAQAWRDTAAKLVNKDIHRYSHAFNEAWNFSQHHYGKRWLKISQQKKRKHRQLILGIRSTTKRVWITNPYFIPDLKLIRALCWVAKNQIDVKVLLPNRSDIFGIKFAMEGLYTLLLTFGVEIYEYSPSMLHAKILILDDWVSMGSSNLDPQSVIYNLEIDAVLTNPASVLTIQNQFVQDLQRSKRIQFSTWSRRSFFNKLLEQFFLYFRGSL